MSSITVLEVSGLDDIVSKLDNLLEYYKKDGVVALRGANLDADEYKQIFGDGSEKHQDIVPQAIEQTHLAKIIGDRLGWFPNSSIDSWNRKFVENHSRLDLSLSDPESPIIDWHLEHVDYDSYIYLVASLWNMWHFEAPSGAGNTWFIDCFDLYQAMSEEDRLFLSNCVLQWYDSDGSGPHQAPAIADHWLLGRKQIRMEITTGVRVTIKTYGGRVPSDEEQSEFRQVKIRLMQHLYSMSENKMHHSWKKGDIVVVDLFRTIHTVGGGFAPSDRVFTNIFAYSKNPEILQEEEKPLIWRSK